MSDIMKNSRNGFIHNLRYLGLIAVIFLGLLSVVGTGGGGDSDQAPATTPTPTTPTQVSSVISPDGGTLEHPDGVTLEFPEGGFDTDTECSIERAQMPEKTTRAATPVGSVYRLEIDGSPSNLPIKITMPLPEGEEEFYTIYRYDGETWYAAGGTVTDDGFIETYSTDFSLFSVVKTVVRLSWVEFIHGGGDSCTVTVANYRLKDPVNSPPVSSAYRWPVFPMDDRRGLLDLGSYQFCAEYYNDTGNPEYFGWRYRYLGGNGIDQAFSYHLSETDPDWGPATQNSIWFTMFVTDTLPGRCGPPNNIGSDPGTNPDGTPISVEGRWEIRIRCAGAETDAIVMDITLNEAGGSFTGTGTGTDYDGTPLDVVVQGGYYLEQNSITGTIDLNNGEAVFTFQTNLASDTDYFSITRTAGYGCEAEARFIKQ
jgi:hypothetical protein